MSTTLQEKAAIDWTKCDSATQELSVEDMIRLIESAPPGPWPSGWAAWPNVNEALRVMARRFADSLTPGRHAYAEGRGIVIAGGGLKYFPSVWVGVHLIRHFGCTLPIQLWHLGKGEIDPYLRRLLKPLGVECVDAREVEKEHPCRILCGWELKPFSTLHSPFEEVLFLDADCGPCRDVTEVFSWPEYLEKGAIFWPDYACWQLKRDVWEIFDIPEIAARWQSEVAFESGQYLINKTRCWSELRMALWYAEHSDFVFRVVYGDKECFHLGWRKLGSDYAMPSKAPGWNQHTIVQWDFRDQQMFNHRCQDKWKLGGGNRRNNSLANEELCFNFVADLRKRWDGVLWHNLDPTPAEQRVIAELVGRRFLYRRVGHDERPVLLEPAGRVGEGAAECERRWDVNIDDGATILTLSRLDRPTCHLQRNGDGAWKGQWLEHERMPIEFIPLEK
jgi:hypothetical protein